jgi:hypothetical protein
VALIMALLGLFPLLTIVAPTPALAASKNVNFNGKWTVVDSGDSSNTGTLTITNENQATGAFGGTLAANFDGSVSPITAGLVTGDQFTLTVITTGTVVGQNGLQTEYGGTISGNTITIASTGIQGWRDGHPISVDTSGGGTGTRIPLVTVSGTVNDAMCGDTGCAEAALEDQDIVVTGAASDGSAVTEAATSSKDGSWSVQVPAGSYTAGPTFDGQAIDGRGFEPEQAAVPVAATPVNDVNFLTCVGPADNSDGANGGDGTDSLGSTASTPASLTSFHAAHVIGKSTYLSASEGSSICKANYTFTLTASIPQSVMVDPSAHAPYNTSTNPGAHGWNAKTSKLSAVLNHTLLDNFPLIGGEPTYPSCLTDKQVDGFATKKIGVKWYTYYTAGANLGRVTIPITWNRSTAKLKFGTATSPAGSLTRIFKIDTPHGIDACSLTQPVVPSYYIDRTGASSFVALAYWPIPFNPIAIRTEASSARVLLQHSRRERLPTRLLSTSRRRPRSSLRPRSAPVLAWD